MERPNVGCLLLFMCSSLLIANALEKPKDISKEMYCMGCQITVKELDFILSHKPTRGMGETVTRALRKVCDVHNFKKYDSDAEKVNTVCKHIRGDEGMEAVLIREYGRKHKMGKQTTYIDMTQMICGTVLGACTAPGVLGDEQNGGLSFDPDTEDFIIKNGKNVRYVNPVKQVNDVPSKPNHTSKDDDTKKVNHPKDDRTAAKASSGKIDIHEEL